MERRERRHPEQETVRSAGETVPRSPGSARSLESTRVQVFRAAARELNFRRAAESLRISQPAVTQAVRALEDELGVRLFDRSRGRVHLTEGGTALLGFAEQQRAAAEEMVAELQEIAGGRPGDLRVGASQTIGQYLLPELLARFLLQHPEMRTAAMSGNTDEVLEALVASRIDLALVEGPGLRPELHLQPFMEDHMVLVVPPGHRWAGRQVEPAELSGEDFVSRELGSGSRRVIEAALEAAGVRTRDLPVRMTLDSTEGLLSAVEAGLGVAFVSRWAVRNQLTLGTLKLARVRGLRIARMFSLVYRSGPEPGGSAGAFRRFLLQEASEMGPRPTGRPR